MSAPQPKHLIPHVSDRGFLHLPPVVGTHLGQINVYESSTPDEACIWMNSNWSLAHKITIELALDEAVKLRDQLTYLIENHYQVKPR